MRRGGEGRGRIRAVVVLVCAIAMYAAGLGAVASAVGAEARDPAKLSVSRNTVDRSASRLDVLAPITKRASGPVAVEFHAAGRRYEFKADVDSGQGWVRFRQRLPRAQAQKGTGIVTLTYPGNSRTRSQQVRLRAASRRAELAARRPTLTPAGGGVRLASAGTLSKRARGVVRVQLDWVDSAGASRSQQSTARISAGKWSLREVLPAAVVQSIQQRRSTVHSYILFTGYEEARMRGEMKAYQVLGAPAAAPAPPGMAIAPAIPTLPSNAAPPAPPPPPAAPPPGPPVTTAGTIAFSSTRQNSHDIYVMSPDGSGVTNLTNTHDDAEFQLDLAQDSSRIAFTTLRGPYRAAIYIMDADGTNVLPLTSGGSHDWQPAISPNGARIAFSSLRDDGDEIYVMNADGSDQTRLTFNTKYADPIGHYDGSPDDIMPDFSPDGSKIAFTSGRDGVGIPIGNYEIYVMDADGKNQTRLTNSPASEEQPAYSPDGTRMAFVSNRDDGDYEIYVMNADGSDQTRLTNRPGIDNTPSFSPDGSAIAFTRRATGAPPEIYVMNADGTSQTNISNNPYFDADPRWGP